MAAQELKCLRCGAEMRFSRQEDIQLGKYTFSGGDLNNLTAGSILTDIYVCPNCGKLEFFSAEPEGDFRPLHQVSDLIVCPRCKKRHSASDTACPMCGLKRDEQP